jgi:hypothetical protein
VTAALGTPDPLRDARAATEPLAFADGFHANVLVAGLFDHGLLAVRRAGKFGRPAGCIRTPLSGLLLVQSNSQMTPRRMDIGPMLSWPTLVPRAEG